MNSKPTCSSMLQLPHKINKEQLLVSLIKELNTRCWFERSYKIKYKKFYINRFVYTIKNSDLGTYAGEKIISLCEKLAMPSSLINSLSGILTSLEYTLFGYEEQENTAFYKVYGEMYIDRKLISTLDKPVTGAFGYKWDAFDNKKHMISRYVWHPMLTKYQIFDKLSNIYSANAIPFQVTRRILRRALSKICCHDLMYLEVSDDNTNRKSFDINFYDAGYTIANILPDLAEIFECYDIPFDVCSNIFAAANSESLGHIAGGIDKDGHDFFSLYCGHKLLHKMGDNNV